jgi:flavodoxin
MPMAVFTFLESYDFSGKTIMPYCTHEGSGMGISERDIKKLCPNAKVLPGLAIRGSSVDSADQDVANWLKNPDLIPA